VETGRVISRRYLLRRLLKQGSHCVVYQGLDQVLQRPVAVKAVPPPHVPIYRSALRMTAQFSHPNIVSLYDLVSEGEQLYVVQEYVEGEPFAALLARQLTPYEVIEIGCQLCQALIYASSNARRVCHGDLTPAAVLLDRQGAIHVNNFALPGDLAYFTSWSVVGGAGIALSDPDLPWGQVSDGRLADDTRAVGLLLYQLLAGRPAGATSVEPPPDGRLRFMRGVPPELCELIARAVLREHPQHINRPEVLYMELKNLGEALEEAMPTGVGAAGQHIEEGPSARAFPATPLPLETEGQPPAFLPMGEGSRRLSAFAPPAAAGPTSSARLQALPSAPTVADASLKVAAAPPRQQGQRTPSLLPAPVPEVDAAATGQRLPFSLLLICGLLVFALFFALGFFLSTLLLH
jgi:hypothetical protein